MFLGDVGSGLNDLKHYSPFQKIHHHLAMVNGVQTTSMSLGFSNTDVVTVLVHDSGLYTCEKVPLEHYFLPQFHLKFHLISNKYPSLTV